MRDFHSGAPECSICFGDDDHVDMLMKQKTNIAKEARKGLVLSISSMKKLLSKHKKKVTSRARRENEKEERG